MTQSSLADFVPAKTPDSRLIHAPGLTDKQFLALMDRVKKNIEELSPAYFQDPAPAPHWSEYCSQDPFHDYDYYRWQK